VCSDIPDCPTYWSTASTTFTGQANCCSCAVNPTPVTGWTAPTSGSPSLISESVQSCGCQCQDILGASGQCSCKDYFIGAGTVSSPCVAINNCPYGQWNHDNTATGGSPNIGSVARACCQPWDDSICKCVGYSATTNPQLAGLS
jgi:hypothetical protein